MKFKIYFQNIEIDLPLAKDERNMEEQLDLLSIYMTKIIENKKVLETFKLKFNDVS